MRHFAEWSKEVPADTDLMPEQLMAALVDYLEDQYPVELG